MPRTIIATDKAGRTRSPLSQAVKVGNLVFVSGTTGYTTDGRIARGDFAAQMRQVMDNIKAILEAAGSSLDRAVKMNVIMARAADFAAMNEVYARHIGDAPPARATVEVEKLPSGALVEIEAVALAG